MSREVHRRFCGDSCLGCNWFVSARNGRRFASTLIQKEIREGRLARADAFACEDCGAPAQQYDHRDYSKPLEVDPVCAKCNTRRGPGKAAWHIYPFDNANAHRLFELITGAGFQHGRTACRKADFATQFSAQSALCPDSPRSASTIPRRTPAR